MTKIFSRILQAFKHFKGPAQIPVLVISESEYNLIMRDGYYRCDIEMYRDRDEALSAISKQSFNEGSYYFFPLGEKLTVRGISKDSLLERVSHGNSSS